MRNHPVFLSRPGLAALCLLCCLALAAPALADDNPVAGADVQACNNIAQLRRQAEAGNSKAQTDLGNCYRLGRGVPRDDRQAVEWFGRAAEQGLAEAQNNLGNMYDDGLGGLPKSRQKAVEWWRKAAAQGHETAKENLRKIGN